MRRGLTDHKTKRCFGFLGQFSVCGWLSRSLSVSLFVTEKGIGGSLVPWRQERVVTSPATMWLRPTPSKQKSTLSSPCFDSCIFFPCWDFRHLFLSLQSPDCSCTLCAVSTSTSKCKENRENVFFQRRHAVQSSIFPLKKVFLPACLPACSRRSVVASYWSHSLWPTSAGGILGRSLDVTQRGSYWTYRTDEEPSWWGRARPLKVREQKFTSRQGATVMIEMVQWACVPLFFVSVFKSGC